MNLLASLLNPMIFPLPEQNVRTMQAPDMRRKEDKRSPAYGKTQSAVLAHLKAARSAQPDQLAEAVGISPECVRRALVALAQEKRVVCVRPAQAGKIRRPSLWKAVDND